MKATKMKIGRLFLYCLFSISAIVTGLSGYNWYVAEAQTFVEGCSGCLSNSECTGGTTCKTGCCPADCGSYAKSCQ